MLDLVVRGRFAVPGGHIEDGEIGIAQGRIAALAGSDVVEPAHIAESLSYRMPGDLPAA